MHKIGQLSNTDNSNLFDESSETNISKSLILVLKTPLLIVKITTHTHTYSHTDISDIWNFHRQSLLNNLYTNVRKYNELPMLSTEIF